MLDTALRLTDGKEPHLRPPPRRLPAARLQSVSGGAPGLLPQIQLRRTERQLRLLVPRQRQGQPRRRHGPPPGERRRGVRPRAGDRRGRLAPQLVREPRASAGSAWRWSPVSDQRQAAFDQVARRRRRRPRAASLAAHGTSRLPAARRSSSSALATRRPATPACSALSRSSVRSRSTTAPGARSCSGGRSRVGSSDVGHLARLLDRLHELAALPALGEAAAEPARHGELLGRSWARGWRSRAAARRAAGAGAGCRCAGRCARARPRPRAASPSSRGEAPRGFSRRHACSGSAR